MTYPSITLTGNIITYDILEKVPLFEVSGQSPQDYGFESKDEIRDEILFVWSLFKERYKRFSDKISRATDDKKTGITRQDLVIPLFSALGYEIHFDGTAEIINDKSYVLSHRVKNLDHFPVHIIGAHQSLDRRAENQRNSPHALVQEYLNHTEHVYGFVSNGTQLRLLRDSSLLTKLSFLEFDLDKMVTEELYADFVLLYLILHHSRMPKSMGQESIINDYHTLGMESGARIRSRLSDAVEKAILDLGDQLLKEPANEELRQWVAVRGAKEYYGVMLKLIYRILFIMVIEERDLIFTEPDKNNKDDNQRYLRNKRIYEEGYSIRRLRKLSENRFLMVGRQYDVWENMKNIFQLFEDRNIGTKIGIAPLGGDLFRTEAIAILYSSRILNVTLLHIINRLHQFETPQGQLIAVNYKSLDVEEFGAVYESLLEKEPVVEPIQGSLASFRFVSGSDRASSGSHYTPDDLVQPLIRHSLEHLITDILNTKTNTENKIQALLKLKIADVACGSGHILLAAARRIGLELARLRTGEEQPAPPAVRQGVRDAIRHCIYGVDKNPYAVELCKVALWLEAHVPGEPLSFLDSKIKCGDAIVGLAHFDELEKGIADEAFKKISDQDDSTLIKDLKKRNAAGKKSWDSIKNSESGNLQKFRLRSDAYEAILAMPEHTLAEVEAKQKAYIAYLNGEQYLKLRRLADLQIAPFFTDKSSANQHKLINTTEYARMISGHQSMQIEAVAHATGLSYERKWFHWFLEFPEVFAQGGFDCILGNPPFLGGSKISGTFGYTYLNFLRVNYPKSGGLCDLVGYFFRRIYSIVSEGSFASLISTNTICQGDTKNASLDFILANNGLINFAIKSQKWPGNAAVEVSLVSFFKNNIQGKRNLQYFLNGKIVTVINGYLDDSDFSLNNYKIKANTGISYNGSSILGKGFFLNETEYNDLLAANVDSSKVLFPVINGDELNNNYKLQFSRFVINFFDWNLKKCENYPDILKIVKERVLPERLLQNDIGAKEKWWLFLRPRTELYEKLKSRKKCLTVALTSKTLAFDFLPTNIVYTHAIGIFVTESFSFFSVIHSCFHSCWAWKFGSTMKSDLRYTSSDIFETYPFPQLLSYDQENELEMFGEQYHEFRRLLMLDVQLGLTKLYNCFHSRTVASLQLAVGSGQYSVGSSRLAGGSEQGAGEAVVRDAYLEKHLAKTPGTLSYEEAVERIVHLRALHKQMDELVLEAYGWHIDTRRWGRAIDLRHDFYEVDYLPENDRVRYTIHPDARKEILKRLLLLNHEVHEAEERGIPYAALDKEKTLALMQGHFQQEWAMDVSKLQPGTLRFLTMAEELWPVLSKTTARIYNAVVQHFGSALESELQEKLFIPFTHFMQQKYTPQVISDLTYKEKEIRYVTQFANKLHRGYTDYTLGTAHILLSIIDDRSHPSVSQSTILQEFRDFYFSIYNHKLLRDPFISRLKAFIDQYRNEAAHTGEIDRAGAEACKEMVKELVRVMVESEY